MGAAKVRRFVTVPAAPFRRFKLGPSSAGVLEV